MHTIVHIGAGQASELPEWLATGAEHIVLVEPNPELAEQLHQKTAQHTHVVVVEAAITTEPGNNQLQEYNLPEASSLRPTTGLKTLFPGLKNINTHTVTTLTPAQLMEQYGPESGQAATLVLQAPGEEQAIIEALAEAEQLSHFSQLVITANPEPFYEGSVDAETLLSTLQTLGYNIQQENQQDADWSTWQLARDPQQDRIAALEQGLQAMEEQLKEKNTNLLVLTQKEEELKKQHHQHHQAELAKHTEQLKTLEQQLAQTRQQKAEADQRTQGAEQARNQVEKARAEEKEQHKAREQKLNSELDELRQQGQQLAPAREALAKEQNAHKQTASALEQARQATAEKEQALKKARQQLEETQQTHKAEKEKQQQQHQAELVKHTEQLKTLEQQLAQTRQQKAEADQRTQDAEQARHQVEKAQAEENGQHKAREQKLNAELEALRQKALQQLESAQQTSKAEAEKLGQLEQQLTSQTNTQNALTTLQERMEYLFGQNTLQLEQATNALGQHVSQTVQNTASELEAGIALQQLAPGTLALSQSEYSLPKSAALELTRQLKAKTYDIIIDLGGTNTRLMADILKHSNQEQPQEKSDQKSLTHYIDASEDDLPKRIISFSHDRNHQKELADQLNAAGAASYVNLQFAPLVPFQYRNQEHLFYDCGNSLQEIAQLFGGRQAKILVMLGSQTDQAGPDARAALPACLQYLSAHQLDLVINTSDNHRLVEESLNLLNQRHLAHTQPKAIGTGQMQQITVNP